MDLNFRGTKLSRFRGSTAIRESLVPRKLRSIWYGGAWQLYVHIYPHRPALPPDAAARARTARVERWTQHLLITSRHWARFSRSQKSKPHIGFFAFFTPYLSNTVISRQSPFYYFLFCHSESTGIAYKSPRNLQCQIRLGHTHTHTHTHTQTDQSP